MPDDEEHIPFHKKSLQAKGVLIPDPRPIPVRISGLVQLPSADSARSLVDVFKLSRRVFQVRAPPTGRWGVTGVLLLPSGAQHGLIYIFRNGGVC